MRTLILLYLIFLVWGVFVLFISYTLFMQYVLFFFFFSSGLSVKILVWLNLVGWTEFLAHQSIWFEFVCVFFFLLALQYFNCMVSYVKPSILYAFHRDSVFTFCCSRSGPQGFQILIDVFAQSTSAQYHWHNRVINVNIVNIT